MFAIDFHTHTYHSYDSLMRPARILHLAKERGLNGIVISDHNTIKGGLECSALNMDSDFKVIVGSEIKTSVGDITGLNLKEEITAYYFSEVIEQIKKQDGLVLLVHPYYHHKLNEIDYSTIDLIEGYNARVPKDKNELAIALAKEHKIPFVAGSDAHLYNEIANCRTYFDDMNNLLLPLNSEFKRNKFYSDVISQGIKVFKSKSSKNFYKWVKWAPVYLYKRAIEKR